MPSSVEAFVRNVGFRSVPEPTPLGDELKSRNRCVALQVEILDDYFKLAVLRLRFGNRRFEILALPAELFYKAYLFAGDQDFLFAVGVVDINEVHAQVPGRARG